MKWHSWKDVKKVQKGSKVSPCIDPNFDKAIALHCLLIATKLTLSSLQLVSLITL